MATPTQIRRRGRFSLILGTLVASVMFVAVALADPITNVSMTVKGTEPTDTYTKTVHVNVAVSATHCPPGGDMNAIEVSFRNALADSWTVVKADGAPWPTGNCASGVPPATPALFSWALALGADGVRTVHTRLRHGGDTWFDDPAGRTIILDATPPIITDHGPTPSGPNGDNNWYTTAVNNLFVASDATSGITFDVCPFVLNLETDRYERSVSTGTNEGSNVKVNSGPCSDVAGNTNTGIDSAAFKIDLSDPSVDITSPSDGLSTSDSSITVTGTASDAISDIATVHVIVNGGTPQAATLNTGWSRSGVALQCGSNTIKARATDNAGRTKDSAEITVTRTCVTYTFAGFHGGVEAQNKAKAGQGVSLRWNLYLGTTEITSTSGFTLVSVKIACDEVGTGDAVPTADDAGSSALRYDLDTGQYVFVWKTLKDWANTCRRFDVTYDGVTLSAEFRFTR